MPGRDRREEVDHRAADQAHRAGGAVLLVVGVQDQQQVDGLLDHRVDVVLLAGRREHQAQEVADVAQPVVGIHERLADRVLVRVGRHGRHLGDQPVHRDLDLALVARVEGVGVEGRERGDRRGAGRHRMRVLRQRAVEALEVLVQHRVVGDRRGEGVELLLLGQLAAHQQVGDLEEGALRSQLLDRVAPVAQDALLAVDEGDRAPARAGVGVAGIEGDEARLVAQLRDVDGALTLGALRRWAAGRSCPRSGAPRNRASAAPFGGAWPRARRS